MFPIRCLTLLLPLLAGTSAGAADGDAGQGALLQVRPRAAPGLGHEVLGLVQTGVSAARWGRFDYNASFYNNTVGFPLALHGNFHFVASVAVTVSFAGVKVHAYDVALYLRSQSRIWGRKVKIRAGHGNSGDLQEMLNDCQVHFHFSTKWVSRGAMATFVDYLYPLFKKANLKDYTEALEDYKSRMLHGPKVAVGSTVVIEPRTDGIRLIINGNDLGVVKHKDLGSITIEGYLDEDTILPTFRREVLRSLARGLTDTMDETSSESVALKRPWYVWLIIALAIAGVLVCLVLSAWCMCCRRGAKGPPAAIVEKLF